MLVDEGSLNFMRKRFKRYAIAIVMCIIIMGICACGEKSVFQTSSIAKEYTNIKLVSIGGVGDVKLNEERSQQFCALFEELVFEQSKTAGSLGGKSYSIVFLNGEEAVDSIQIFADGKTIGYGGYFYELSDASYDVEAFLALFKEQEKEAEALQLSAAIETEVSSEEILQPESAEGTSPSAEESKEEVPQEGKAEADWIELDAANFESCKIIPIPIGEGCMLDLDGDGSKEEIICKVEADESRAVLFAGEEEKELEMLVSPDTEHYFITDLDLSDAMYEIATLDNGPSADPEYHFWRYREGKLIYMGSIFTDTTYDNLVIKGDGKVVGSGRLSLLQTWAAPFSWYVDGDSMKLLEEEWYYPYVVHNSENVVKQIKEVLVYEEADLGAAKKVTEASEAAVTFGITDNKSWVQIFTADGTVGWLYLEDGFYIESGEEKVPVTEVFENLSMAG